MLRRRSIRTRIIVLVLVPVVALIGLYAVALSLTLSSFLSLKQAADVRNELATPVTNLQLQLNNERGLALQYLANPTTVKLAALISQEPKTDAAVSRYLSVASKTNANAEPGERTASRRWAIQLATLPALRQAVVSVTPSRASAAVSYSTLIAGADYVLTQAVLPVLTSTALIQANDVLTMEESLQSVAEERDLFAADLAARNYPGPDSRLVNQLITQHWELWNQATSSLDNQFITYFSDGIPTATASALTDLETPIAASSRSALRVSYQAWRSVTSAYTAGFRKALYTSSNAIRATGVAQARGVLIQLLLIGGLGLLAIIAAIAVAIVISSALLRQLDELRLSALELSSVRLPAVLARLRSGDEIDVGTETPQLDPGANEIGQLGRAFNIAAQTAVGAAVDEAEIRRGVNDVFRNLARRNQSLLTRQLELLDAMERRVHDPEELADLFRVDHLTTRMRRHAEGLLIVAGGSSGRVWREPVPIVDVMRAAVAEIEDYTRIRVTSRSSSSVAGHAVADIIHMLAELVENATTFSPANTPVRIESDNVAKGLIVEIEDRGLGMADRQIEEINSKLNDPPLLDLSGSEQLGLYIAGQLARRHDVKITMRGSAYGGITAVVLIPSTLVIDPGYDEPLTVAGLRELGGRPVPQLPAASLSDDAAASAESVAVPDPVSAVGYILDLEAGVGSVTTTAAQIGTGEFSIGQAGADQNAFGRGRTGQPDVGPSFPGTGPYEPYTEHVDAELVSADLAADDATSADSTVPGTGEAEPVGLKGAGAWLAEAESANRPEPAGEAGHPGSTPPVISPAPMLALGHQADLTDAPSAPGADGTGAQAPERTTHLSPADDWAALLNQAATSSPPAQAAPTTPGWPDLPAASSGWLNLGPGPSGETTRAPDNAPLPHRGSSRADAQGNGSYGLDGDPLQDPSLPKRHSRTSGLSFGQDLADTDSFGPVPSEPSPGELDGLPVRVRQANLAPQLRDPVATPKADQYVAAPQMLAQTAPAQTAPADNVPAEQAVTGGPSPEAARTFMSALQRGWERGRSMAEHMTDEPDDEQS